MIKLFYFNVLDATFPFKNFCHVDATKIMDHMTFCLNTEAKDAHKAFPVGI